MPCGCQKNKIQQNADKNTAIQRVDQNNQAKTEIIPSLTTTIAPQGVMVVPQDGVLDMHKQSDSVYDFRPTTEPMDTCAYCAMKHIALASSLLDYDDYFSAAGQLQLAGYHYNTANEDMSQRCKELARLFITAPNKAKEQLPALLKEALTYPAEGTTKQTNPGKLNYDPIAAMVHLAAAQALIYTQVFYEQLNKAYAVGQLIIAAVNIQLKHRDIAREFRKVWKIIQEIKAVNDQPYKDAQSRLLDCKAMMQRVLSQQMTPKQAAPAGLIENK